MSILLTPARSLLAALICLGSGAAVAGSLSASTDPSLTLKPWLPKQALAIEAIGFVPGTSERLAASERDGLLLLDAQGQELARLKGSFNGLDSRAAGQQVLVATLDSQRQQALLVSLDPHSRQWGQPLYLPPRDFPVNGLCLYRDEASNLFLFLVGEEGKGEQWLVGAGSRLSATAQRVRGVPLPPAAQFCQVDDGANQLLVNEENVGWWAYPAHPEADVERRPVAMRAPFGEVAKAAGAMALVPGGVLALDPKAARLHLYQQQGGYLQQGEGWSARAALALPGLKEPESLAVQASAKGLQVLVRDDDDGQIYQGRLDWQATPVPLAPVLPNVPALSQSEPVGRQGDAADDPAIWIHPRQPELSRVLGTNKKQGLLAYDLQGKLLQELPVGRLNNVDLRPNFKLGTQVVDLAVASNRDHNSLSLFSIDRASGELREAGEIPTPLKEIYGICLFQPASGELYAFANGKDGSFLQYRLSAPDGRVQGELVRQFKVDSQPEGCVADDQRQRLFLGEEDVGVWAVDARADQPANLASVIEVGPQLHADVEGLALYQSEAHDYLVISSQGNDSYVVLDAEPPFASRGAFRVGLNAAAGIDGASETDGLEVTSANLGGPWSQGLLVVQDGRKRMPEQTQNFKFVPWAEVARALKLP
ncbi:phytase [Pseudomonas chlororaphis]|uniref:3-phytase PhyC n=1 Tax=Pseudomonas chlororaphis TaxID=587753 RepID=A0AAX3FS86_9PSED|nr:phytase [Pseudomonas chlororaphis]AZC38456.1 3-phytase [Pseudomonas chlororaphis subsp. piscium]AZC45005.1 3-phytase [Pseudomonas chlororaphis subsp. piscium]WDG70595.1 phytase [Pseudomonas chlororaphis]WDH31618.1 phytase [Pseudomonas chlororaphis]WDH69121.1 phytase [Pseudomonas chlororaphis]